MGRKNIKSECDFIGFENKRLNYRCKECKGKSTKTINGLIEKFPSVYQFYDGDLSKFVLLLRKGVYPCEYMNSQERFDETSLLPKKAFYSELNLEDITDKDYNQAQKVWKVFGTRNLDEDRDLNVQCDHTLMLADVLKNLDTHVLKYTDLILLISYLHLDQHGRRA